MNVEKLIQEAMNSLEYCYAPYSKFKVGAALLTEEGQIYTGCNIENASFSGTVCAERTAIFKAVSEGKKRFVAIAVVGGKEGAITDYCSPCGICRQIMMEFCDPKEFQIIMAKSNLEYKSYRLEELLPLGFGGGML